MESLESHLTPEQLAAWTALDSPAGIQAYLDQMPYIGEDRNRSPLEVIRDGQCHCLDGGLLAAAALRRLGYPALVLELWPEPGTDDDHVLAVYRVDGGWGALAKSNFAFLRAREPVYRSLRELAMSYFEVFFNLLGQKTLRRYSRPLDLSRYDRHSWETREPVITVIEKHLYRLPTYPLISPAAAARLAPVDERSLQAGTLGTDPKETYFQRH